MHKKKKSTRVLAAGLFALLMGGAAARPALAGSYDSNDFLVATNLSGTIAIFDENLTFKSFLDSNLPGATGIDLLPNGNAVVASQNGIYRIYNPAGELVSTFTDERGNAGIDIKVTSNRIYATVGDGDGVQEFDLSGARQRRLGDGNYLSIVLLPDNVMWDGNGSSTGVDRLDLATGNQLPAFDVDNGQTSVSSMRYSPSTSTVLMSQYAGGKFFERNTDGTFVRQFTAPETGFAFGITRGPGGNVYATDYNGNLIYRWTANGTYLGSTNIARTGVNRPTNIMWTGEIAALTNPTAQDDSVTTVDRAGATTISVLANDTSNSGGTLTVTAVTQPSNGTATFNGTSVTYTPNAGFTGNDSFTYTVTDSNGGTAIGTVNIIVAASNAELRAQGQGAINGGIIAAGKAKTNANDTFSKNNPTLQLNVVSKRNGKISGNIKFIDPIQNVTIYVQKFGFMTANNGTAQITGLGIVNGVPNQLVQVIVFDASSSGEGDGFLIFAGALNDSLAYQNGGTIIKTKKFKFSNFLVKNADGSNGGGGGLPPVVIGQQ